MPTLKICQHLHRIKQDGTAQLYIRITHGRKTVFVKTGYFVKPSQLKEGTVIKHPDANLLNMALEQKKSELLQSILKQNLLNEGINIGKAAGKRPESTETMFGAIKHVMKMYEAQNKPASLYRMRTNLEYIQNAWIKDKYLTDITKLDVEKFANYRYQLGNTASTVKKNINDLGAVLNHVDFQAKNPFADYAKKIKAKPVQREKLTAEEIKLLENVQLKGMADLARDMFLFSFYAQGMRFESVATLGRDAIRDNHIYYRMNKGEKTRELFVHPKLHAIIEKYIESKTLYLFPVVKETHTIWNKKDVIGRANVLVNNFLINAAQQAGIGKHVHFHQARHTFAYLSLKKDVSYEIIKDALGHTNFATTKGYLDSLSDDMINAAVKSVYQ